MLSLYEAVTKCNVICGSSRLCEANCSRSVTGRQSDRVFAWRTVRVSAEEGALSCGMREEKRPAVNDATFTVTVSFASTAPAWTSSPPRTRPSSPSSYHCWISNDWSAVLWQPNWLCHQLRENGNTLSYNRFEQLALVLLFKKDIFRYWTNKASHLVNNTLEDNMTSICSSSILKLICFSVEEHIYFLPFPIHLNFFILFS